MGRDVRLKLNNNFKKISDATNSIENELRMNNENEIFSAGLKPEFPERLDQERKLLKCVRKLYASYTRLEGWGMSVVACGVQAGEFKFRLDEYGATTETPIVDLTFPYEASERRGIQTFKVENIKGRLYLEFDWDAFKAVGEMICWGWPAPLCKLTNLISKDDPIWSTLIPSQLENLNFGVDGDSITAGNQWSALVAKSLKFETHHNVAVGSAMYQNRTVVLNGKTYKTQNYYDADFKGISAGWEETTDPVEIQKRINNCAMVHIQKFLAEVHSGTYPIPDIFVFAMGTNDFTLGTSEAALKGKGAAYLSEEVKCTMAGGARWAIQTIMETYPNCRVFVSLPIQRADPEQNKITIQKNKILREICESLSVQVIETYKGCGITEKKETGTGPYLSDGLHPNAEGTALIANYIAKEIRNNYF